MFPVTADADVVVLPCNAVDLLATVQHIEVQPLEMVPVGGEVCRVAGDLHVLGERRLGRVQLGGQRAPPLGLALHEMELCVAGLSPRGRSVGF